MSKKSKVIIKGVGQLNGPVLIDLTVEMEPQQASAFMGGNRDEVLIDFLRSYYPGVKIDPKAVGVNLIP